MEAKMKSSKISYVKFYLDENGSVLYLYTKFEIPIFVSVKLWAFKETVKISFSQKLFNISR